MIRILTFLGLLVSLSTDAVSQHAWQKPPKRDAEKVAAILGPAGAASPTRDLTIVWVWGVDQSHDPGFHEYEKVRDKYASLFRRVPRVTFEVAKQFPSEAQWKRADLVVFYLQLDALTEQQLKFMDGYLRRGGGLVAIHAAMIHPGPQLASRFGLAWDPQQTQWGALPKPATIDAATPHGIMKGFPDQISLVDEHYWNLTGSVDEITVLATAPAGPSGASTGPPGESAQDGKAWPLFWTKEVSKGRVFGSIPGHNLFTFDDPYFRIILLRGMAWAMRQPMDPFKPLVTANVGNRS